MYSFFNPDKIIYHFREIFKVRTDQIANSADHGNNSKDVAGRSCSALV
jgi:hypothetical protein